MQTVKYKATVTVYIDTDSLQNNINAWKQQDIKKRQAIVSAVEGKRKFIEDFRQNVSDAEAMINRGADKNAVQGKLTEIERETLAMKKLDEGLALHEQDNFQGAIKLYNEAIQLKPDFSWAYNNRGIVYYNLGKYQQAIADCSKAIELNPKFAEAYQLRSLSYKKLGNIAKANADFVTAKELGDK